MFQVWGIYLLLPSSGIFSSQIILIILLATSGFTAGVFAMTFILDKSYNSVKTYKRELEKESITSLESTSQIKVLEAKIEVLEKALQQALNK